MVCKQSNLSPDPSTKKGTMILPPSPCPFFTPRPENSRFRRRESSSSRLFDSANHLPNRPSSWSDREVNVQVLLRCRPLNEEEQRLNIPMVISCDEHRREITILQTVANNYKQLDRAFTFDKVFGPKAQQRSIYDHAVSPLVYDVLRGFNCTVFAYGQTGTGKTYTMEGGIKNKGRELSAEAGVIPRAVRQIFDVLQAQKADYSIKVTFLELYNEEITDLLAPEDFTRSMDDRQKKPISLMEDGKGGVIVRGLEEEVVYSANEIFTLLERGSSKRRTVDTLLNKHSSRSHSIFSITIHVKEATIGDEDLIKCGKLNLVDLAGSENISRSGAREARAREAGEINKSLLTLGRVINTLVEHSAHIPYRDSKLTRLLRDSLGGKTKTCIIATVSPSVHCLDETLSTLDYACRAKNIKNKPEVNQKLSKAVLLKDLYLEMERMKQDVRAAREKNGIYIPQERFAQDEAAKKTMNEKIEHLEIELDQANKQAAKYEECYLVEQEQKLDLENELRNCKKKLENCNEVLQELQENHRMTISVLKEKEFIISNLLHSENSILERAKELRANLENASEDITELSTEIDRKNKMERENHGLVLTFGSQLDQSLKNLHRTVLGSVSQQQQQLRCMEEHIGSFLASKCDASEVLESKVEEMKDRYSSGVYAMNQLAEMLQKESISNLKKMESIFSAQTMAVKKFLATAVKDSVKVVQDIHSLLNEQKHILAFSARQQEEGLKRNLVSAQVISKETIEFFNDLHCHFSKLIKIINEDQIVKSQQLAAFGKTFQEESSIEEKLALEKIAVILGNLTSKKTVMVSKALRNMDEDITETKGRLEQEMIEVQNISANAKRECNGYLGKVQSHFIDDTFSTAESRATMENIIQECSTSVDDSRKQWEHAQLCIDHIKKNSIKKIGSIMEEKIVETQGTLEEIKCLSSSTSADSDARAHDLLKDVNHFLQLDQEAMKDIESTSTLGLAQLKLLQENHGENVSNIRSRADKCLTKEYLVDHCASTTCEKQAIGVPTLRSIEELRTPAAEDLVAKFRSSNSSKGGYAGTTNKIQHQQHSCSVSPNRTPFTTVN